MKFAIDSGLKEQILEQLFLTAPWEQLEGLSPKQDGRRFSLTWRKPNVEKQDGGLLILGLLPPPYLNKKANDEDLVWTANVETSSMRKRAGAGTDKCPLQVV